MSIIQTKALTKLFGEIRAVDQLSLEVKEGEIYGLVGPDGSGKTTTIRLLTSIMDPTSGTASVDGKDTVKDAQAIKKVIGYMSQKFGLYQDLTVLENLTFYADLYGIKRRERQKKIEELLQFSQLLPFQNRLTGHLSGGMKQKLGLACTLIHTPKVLFLDEPTNGVDPISRRDFWRILYQLLKERVTIFISTAYMDEAERCQHIGFLHQGQLLTSGTPTEIKTLLPGSILELQIESPREAAKILQKHFGENQVALFGTSIHLLTNHPEETVNILPTLLKDFQADAIQPISPSLEDVFIALLSKSGHSNAFSKR